MNRFYKELNRFLVAIANPESEKNFLKWSLPSDLNFFKKIVYAGVAATLLFSIPDYVKSGFDHSFILSLASRTIFSLFILLAFYFVQKKNSPAVFHAFTFVLSWGIILNTSYVIIVMKNHSVTYALSELTGIIVMYILLKQRFISAVLTAIPASVIFISIHIFNGGMDVSSIQTIAFAFIFVNFLGIIYNRDTNFFHRIEFLSLAYEQNLNDRLENEIIQREKFQNEILELTRTDFLTGLFNRRYFVELGNQEIIRCERYSRHLSLISIDIDYFKDINDRYGHPEGDEVLKSIGGLLKSRIRKSDLVARIGGEEFIVLVYNGTMNDARNLAGTIVKTVASEHYGKNKNINLTISAGIAEYQNGDSLFDLMSKSDKALYMAKEAGRNRVVPC